MRQFAAPFQLRAKVDLVKALAANWRALTAFLNGYAVTRENDGTLVITFTVTLPTVKSETSKLSFYGGATVTKPNVTGAKGGNAALGNLMTALSNLGLVTDSTT